MGHVAKLAMCTEIYINILMLIDAQGLLIPGYPDLEMQLLCFHCSGFLSC